MTQTNRPKVRFHNTETDEVIDREMNNDEFAQWQKEVVENDTRQAETTAKAKAKAELLAKLGITADEAKLLLS